MTMLPGPLNLRMARKESYISESFRPWGVLPSEKTSHHFPAVRRAVAIAAVFKRTEFWSWMNLIRFDPKPALPDETAERVRHTKIIASHISISFWSYDASSSKTD
jgi:hypothetical protein